MVDAVRPERQPKRSGKRIGGKGEKGQNGLQSKALAAKQYGKGQNERSGEKKGFCSLWGAHKQFGKIIPPARNSRTAHYKKKANFSCVKEVSTKGGRR